MCVRKTTCLGENQACPRASRLANRGLSVHSLLRAKPVSKEMHGLERVETLHEKKKGRRGVRSVQPERCLGQLPIQMVILDPFQTVGTALWHNHPMLHFTHALPPLHRHLMGARTIACFGYPGPPTPSKAPWMFNIAMEYRITKSSCQNDSKQHARRRCSDHKPYKMSHISSPFFPAVLRSVQNWMSQPAFDPLWPPTAMTSLQPQMAISDY